MFKKIIYLSFITLFASNVFAGTILHHKISVTLEPDKHYIDATDQITIPAADLKPVLYFLLNKNLKVTCESPRITLKLEEGGIAAEDFGIDREDFELSSDNNVNKYSLTFSDEPTEDITVTLKFSGVINYSIEQLGEEYARGFSQTPGIIDQKGVYLAGSTYWVPWFNNHLITFELTTTIPESWNVVSQGKRTVNDFKDDKHVICWDSPEPMEEIYLIQSKCKSWVLPIIQ